MSRAHEPARPDLHQQVTDLILADLETGVRPWTRPWSDGGLGSRPLRHDGQPYHGINVLVLWAEADIRDYTSPIWMTFRQALAHGDAVRKGEKGVRVVYANRLTRSEIDDQGQTTDRSIAYLKSYTVFNLGQIEGLSDRYVTAAQGVLDRSEQRADIEAFFAATGAVIDHGGDQAYYAPGPDRIQMPMFERFVDPAGYYATLGHEMTHWTRHPLRLDRDFGRGRFGDANYAREELVAELGAAFLCADLGLALEPRHDHAAYLASWLQVLRDDKRFIVSAATHAERAVAYLHQRQPTPPG